MQANDLRKGIAIIHQGQIYVVADYSHHTPGNKRAFVQTTLKELKTGKIIQNRFSSTEEVPVANLDTKHAQYLYHDRDGYQFMDLEDYHTFALPDGVVGDQKYYLKENDEIDIDFHDGTPVLLKLPSHVFLKVVQSPPGIRGDSVSNALKTAVLETGLKIQVPLFIQEGNEVKVDTRTGAYLSRK